MLSKKLWAGLVILRRAHPRTVVSFSSSAVCCVGVSCNMAELTQEEATPLMHLLKAS